MVPGWPELSCPDGTPASEQSSDPSGHAAAGAPCLLVLIHPLSVSPHLIYQIKSTCTTTLFFTPPLLFFHSCHAPCARGSAVPQFVLDRLCSYHRFMVLHAHLNLIETMWIKSTLMAAFYQHLFISGETFYPSLYSISIHRNFVTRVFAASSCTRTCICRKQTSKREKGKRQLCA